MGVCHEILDLQLFMIRTHLSPWLTGWDIQINKKLRGAHPTAESRKQNISKNSAVYIVPQSLTFAQRSLVQLRDHLQWSSCTAGSFCYTVKSQGKEGDLPLRQKKVPRLVNHGYTHDTTTVHNHGYYTHDTTIPYISPRQYTLGGIS